MAEEVVMPKLGVTMEEGEIVEWHKEEGDEVERGELLLEVLTDKATLEVEAPADGVFLKKLYEAGETIPVTKIIGIVGEKGEDISDILEQAQAEKESDETEKEIEEEEEVKIESKNEVSTPEEDEIEVETSIVRASPAARRVAREKGVEISEVEGTGPRNRVTVEDVKEHAKAKEAVEETSVVKEKLTGLKKAGAQRVADSWQQIPHVTLTEEVDMTSTLELLEEINDSLEVEVSVTDVLLKTAAKELKEYPELNADLAEETVEYNEEINIGLAVDVEGDLTVPVLKDVDKKGLKEITEDKKELVDKALNSKLTKEDIRGSRFAISNLGMFGVEIFTPIINAPGSGILGVGTIKEKPVAVDGEVEIRPMMWLSLSFDHRLINGAPAAEFLKMVKKILENPELLVF